MRRPFRQYYYLVIILCSGILFYYALFIHNRALPNPDDSKVTLLHQQNSNYKELSRKLDSLEREIESQVQDSNGVLQRIKSKFGSNSSLAHKLIDKVKGARKKLDHLHHDFDDEPHLGEVHSGGEHVQGKLSHDEEDENGAHEVLEEQSRESVIAILVIVCNRPTVTRCLDKLLKYRSSPTKFPIILSQDCGHHPKTIEALRPYEDKLIHIFQPNMEEIQVEPAHSQFFGYYKISRHYGWALNQVFNHLNYSNLIIVEDDIEVAPDFFEYFSSTLPLLKEDPTLWCVSAWNDNGKENRIDLNAPELLYRTDFFPGLGWMLTKELFKELRPKWPPAFWDDWMREPVQRKGRACIRPEISRTSTFGKLGVSKGTYYQTHLKFIKLNDKFVPFSTMDLTYLTKDKYDESFLAKVNSAQQVGSVAELVRYTQNVESGHGALDYGDTRGQKSDTTNKGPEYKLQYKSNVEFRNYARALDIMEDFKAGVPRTAYRGIVSIVFGNRRVYLTPSPTFSGYNNI